jgi:adhesin transport system outer membrane protein
VSEQLMLGIVAILLASGAIAQTLEDAVRTTLQTNPDILASRYNVDAAGHLARQAKAAYLPSVDLVLAAGRESSNNTTTQAISDDPLRLTRKERSLKITQMLYDGLSSRRLVEQQTALTESAIARLASIEETIGVRAVQVYVELMRREAVAKLTNKNLVHHDETLGKISERFENGVGTRIDLVQTQGRRAQSKGNVLLAERDAKNGIAEFFRVVGENPSALSLPATISGLPSTLEEAIQTAMLNNPGLQASKADLKAAVAAQKQSRAAYRPRFDLELGATRNDDGDGSKGGNDDETAVIRMTYNLYRGGADKARMNETQAREFAARETVRSVERSVAEDVTLVWNELDDILVRLEYLETHVKSTEEVLTVYNEQFSLGKRTLLDLLDVQNELLGANIAYLTGQYTATLARYRVLASTGRLLDSMGLSVSSK